ncbi:MAG: hypothetical protein ACJ8KU_08140 [Chthoniobacterales bacterium]
MSDHNDKKGPPPAPANARLLHTGEIINDGDLHWQPAVERWVAVTPQGEETVGPDQEGRYCRKIDE